MPEAARYPINAPCGYISPGTYAGIVLLYLLGIALCAGAAGGPVVLVSWFAIESTPALLGLTVSGRLAGLSAVYGALHLWGGGTPRHGLLSPRW